MHLAHAALNREDDALAVSRFEEALAILTAASDPQTRNVLLCHEGLAHAHLAGGRLRRARTHAQVALEGLSESLPVEHPELAALRAILDESD